MTEKNIKKALKFLSDQVVCMREFKFPWGEYGEIKKGKQAYEFLEKQKKKNWERIKKIINLK